MSDLQIEEIHRTRTASPHIGIYSPVSGFVLTRNISPSQRFDKGTELYRIADISRVWVMTDIFEKDREFLKPGAEAAILYQGRRLKARMSDALPQLDAQSRILKARFELDNPDHVLQPDLFVEVEVPVTRPPAITVPADAVVDSGDKKTVYVAKGDGVFEPRRVETGWRAGDQVEIVKGLMAGEKIVVSGTFLIDSESRMKAAAAGIYGETQRVSRLRDGRGPVQGQGGRPDERVPGADLLFLRGRGQGEIRQGADAVRREIRQGAGHARGEAPERGPVGGRESEGQRISRRRPHAPSRPIRWKVAGS